MATEKLPKHLLKDLFDVLLAIITSDDRNYYEKDYSVSFETKHNFDYESPTKSGETQIPGSIEIIKRMKTPRKGFFSLSSSETKLEGYAFVNYDGSVELFLKDKDYMRTALEIKKLYGKNKHFNIHPA